MRQVKFCLTMMMTLLTTGAMLMGPSPVEAQPTATPSVSAKASSAMTHSHSNQTITNKEQFLEAWQRRCFEYMWQQADPHTGLVADRARADGSNRGQCASIAATGFALTGLCIADHRGWISHDQAYQRALTTLRFLYEKAPEHKGFFYHYMDIKSGKRIWDSELSSVDTALLMAGVLTVKAYYPKTEAARLAEALYRRVDWPWMLNGGSTMSMGWRPDTGFIDARWDHYSEHMILELLGMGSPTHPLPPAVWRAWSRTPLVTYDGLSFLSYPPLFVHQFSHAWIDFRHKRDDYANYWLNSVFATRAQRAMCIAMRDRFPQYGPNMWGITSSDSEHGYTAWGGPEPLGRIDGTIVPCAAGGSIPFLPEECIDAVYHMYKTYGDKIWKRYGLVDAFNPGTGWVDQDVIGIDTGITLLMIENHRSGFVWHTFMQNDAVQRAMHLAGFRSDDATPAQIALRTTSVFDEPQAAKASPELEAGAKVIQADASANTGKAAVTPASGHAKSASNPAGAAASVLATAQIVP